MQHDLQQCLMIMQKLLALLADGDFHSGNELGSEIGISRAAVWKRLQKIDEEYGLVVQSIPGKGYRLAHELRLLKPDTLQAAFPSLPIYLYDSIASTNVQAKKLLVNLAAPFAVLAEHQTQGRGRRGRQWSSPYGQNLYLSFVWPVCHGMEQIDGLSLVVGLAVVRAIEQVTGVSAQLKWPNDVLVDGCKAAGILLELVGDPADLCHVIIGIGVNLNMVGTQQNIDQEWTSLYKVTEQLVDRTQFAQCVLEQLERYLDKQTVYGFKSLKHEWQSLHAWHGCKVVLSSGHELVNGQISGIGDKGEISLIVDGKECQYIGGELSLRLQNDS